MKKNYPLASMKKCRWLASVIIFFISIVLNAQTIGDFQTRNDVTNSFTNPLSWEGATTWQIYTASGWQNTTSYPGGSGTLSTATVTIRLDTTVRITTVSTTVPTYSFGNLNVYGKLILKANTNSLTGQNIATITFSTTNVVNIIAPNPSEARGTPQTNDNLYGNGIVFFDNTDAKLRWKLKSNAVVNIRYIHYDDPNYKRTGLIASNCSNNADFFIGTTEFAVCNGAPGSIFTFRELTDGGGTIQAIPSASPSTTCESSTTGGSVSIALSGSYSGAIGDPPTYTWEGTGPGSYSYYSTTQNPTVQLTTPGVYTFNLIVQTNNQGTLYSNAQITTVRINPRPKITNMTATQCSGQTFNVSPTNGTNGVVPSGTTYTWSAPVVTGGITGGTAGSGTSIVGSLVNTTGSPQTATYTVTPTSGAGCTGSTFTVTLTVNASALTGPSILSIGQTATYVGAPTPGTYTSSNPTVATINSSGLVTALAEGTTVIRFTNTATGCYETITLNVGTICTKLPTSATVTNPALDTKFGITSLGRASTGSSNWPGVRKGAYLVMESKVNGFVLPRLTQAQINAIASADLVQGMAVYNLDSKCFYVYNGTSWQCYKTQGCSN